MTALHQLITILNDQRFHSGTALGVQLNTCRSNIWKMINTLKQKGLDIQAVPKKGYRLSTPIELLSHHTITSQLDAHGQLYADHMHIFPIIDSTNTFALEKLRKGHREPMICFAEEQSAGRGRRGNHWVSPFGQNIYCTMVDFLAPNSMDFSSISLCISIAIADCLRHYTNDGAIQIKWPNDILCHGKKISGILIESITEANDQIPVVIGMGINLNMQTNGTQSIDQTWADLKHHSTQPISRNTFAAQLINHVSKSIVTYKTQGFAAFHPSWQAYDALKDQSIALQQGTDTITGIARGISNKGELIIERSAQATFYASYGVAHSVRHANNIKGYTAQTPQANSL
jgi:BirA family transcriptional regulator, biotin operon repressor / biotin---[acetyl-CoA-carboxylase] ligase